MVFGWKTSLQNCFRYYKQNLGAMFIISALLTGCELIFITMLQHAYWIVQFFPVYLLFFVFVFQYLLLVGIIRLHQGFIAYCQEIVRSGRSKLRQGLEKTRGRTLRGLRSNLTVFVLVLLPSLAYFMTILYIGDLVTRAITSTLLLVMVFLLLTPYHFIQVAAASESKLVNDLRISTTITRMYFKETLLYSFLAICWIVVPLHVWLVIEQGRIHFCGCAPVLQTLALCLTLARPIWVMLQVQVYAYVKRTHFPVPEMDPDLRDRNLI